MPDVDWPHELGDQLRWHWEQHLCPRLNGLTDEEISGSPRRQERGPAWASVGRPCRWAAAPSRSISPFPSRIPPRRGGSATSSSACSGPGLTSHFGGPPVDYQSFAYAGTAAEALDQLDEVYDALNRGVDSLGADSEGCE